MDSVALLLFFPLLLLALFVLVGAGRGRLWQAVAYCEELSCREVDP